MKSKTCRPHSKRFTKGLIASIAALGTTSYGQLSVTDTSTSYLINFDQSVVGVSNGAWAGTGFDPGASASGLLDSNAWAVTGWSSGALAFGGTQTTAATDYTRGAASAAVNTGGMYAFSGGNITTGVALGFQPGTSDWAPGTLTLRVKNDSVSLITGFSLDYKLWVRNDQNRSNSFNFSRSADNTAYTPEITADYTSDAPLNALGFTLVPRTITISGISIAAGDFYYLRWSGADVGGSNFRDEFALDDISLSAFTTGVAARNILWSPITGAWDTTSANWTELGLPVTFQATDNVTFDDTGLAQGSTVTIQAAGVTVGNTKVTNTTDTYTFVGGAISGSGSLTKSGAGRLVLRSANAFTGGTTISEGTLSVSADDQLGATTSGILLSALGTLETTGSLTLNAGRSLTGSGKISIAPSTTLAIAGSANTGALTLPNTGSLSFSGAISPQIGGFNIQSGIGITSVQPLLLSGPFNTTNPEGTVTLAGPLGLGAATRIFTIADGTAPVDASISGPISSSSTGGRLQKLGDGTLALLGDNSGMTGGVQLGTAGSTPANGGTLILNSSTSLGPGGAGSAGQFRFNPGTLLATQAIQFPATLSATIGNGAPLASTFSGSDIEFLGPVWFFRTTTAPQLPVGHIIVAESNVRFAAPFANPTAANQTSDLTIRGAGSVTFAAGGTWTGDVFIDGGKLFISGNVLGSVTPDARPAFNAGTGGLLGGNVSGSDSLGSITASGSAGSPGIISPGTPLDTTGVITTTSLTVLPDGLLAMNLGGVVDGEFDQIVVNGSAYIRGQLSLSLVGGFIPPLGQTFTLILNDGADQQQPDDLFIGKAEDSTFMADGYEFRINYNAGIDANDVVLTVVPEPGSIALLLGGLGFLGLSRRRRS